MKRVSMAWLRAGVLLAIASMMATAAERRAAAWQPADDGQTGGSATLRGDRMLAEYFRQETFRLRDACLADIDSRADWEQRRPELHRQLMEMLGLDPLPERTPLNAATTGRTESNEFVVERVQFQSLPGLYVTGNLYLPKVIEGKLPAILYVCGHGGVKKNGVSYGNKVHYQHHGAWFARNGYVCLTIDSLQLGEIEGIHHGTYTYGMWWWLNRGYTPAGVEAWNCIRALDYLQARPEVDGDKLGVTGRSGGGAYSWWIAAADERIKAAVPVAGITDLENHVVDGVVEGHCDCMYFCNTYRWDYPLLAALVAPRPLLISNTDRDGIFPLEGVVRVHAGARKIYRLYGADEQLALQITAGEHVDTQELHIHAFRWFNHFLKGDDAPIAKIAEKYFEPEQLRVFESLPADQRNTRIQEEFVPSAAEPAPPADPGAWERQRDAWRAALRDKVFRAWPQEEESLDVQEAFAATAQGVSFRAVDFRSQGAVKLRLYVAQREDLAAPELMVLNVLDAADWRDFLATYQTAFGAALHEEQLPGANEASFAETAAMFRKFPWAMAYVAPRGIGPSAWNANEKKQVQHQRRFYLLGQTVDGMRVWDVIRAAHALRALPAFAETPLWLQSRRQMGAVALYAAILGPPVKRLDLYDLPATHAQGPFLLNIDRVLGLPQALTLAAERSQVVLYNAPREPWDYAAATAKALAWDAQQLQFRQ